MPDAAAEADDASRGVLNKAPDYSPAEVGAYAAARFPATYAVLVKVRRLAMHVSLYAYVFACVRPLLSHYTHAYEITSSC